MATSINIPISVSPALSGYTGNLTTFLFTPTWGASAIAFDQTKALWNFGDGTYSTSPSGSKIYNWPGAYTVSVTLYGLDGTVYENTYTQVVTAFNFIVDQVVAVPANKTFNIFAGRVSPPLRCDRFNSWQSFAAVSATGYTYNFYVSGSLSNKLNLNSLATNKWAHIERTWRFTEQVIDSYGNIQYLPIDNIVTSNEQLYYKNVGGIPTRCLAADTGSVFVGTSGTATFYYFDDTPKNLDTSTTPVFLFISLDTTRFPDSYQILSPQVANLTVYPDLELFQHLRTVITARIRYNAATALVFTSPGMLEIPISKHKWQGTEVPFFINLVDSTGAIVNNYPPLTVNTGVPVSSADVVNLSLTYPTNQPLSAAFFNTTDDGLPPAISATYRGYFIPYQVHDTVTLSGSVTVFNPLNFQLDTGWGWIVQPDTSSVYRIEIGTVTNFAFSSGGLAINTSQQNNVYDGKSDFLFSVAAAPSASSDITVDPYVWITDQNNDVIKKMDTSGAILSTIVLSALLGTPVNYKLSPSSVALDGNNNIWVTLFDAVCAIKINGTTGQLMLGVYDPLVTNVQYLCANQLSAIGGTNLLQPCCVDTDSKNNVWVAYTHPLCAHLVKFDGTTGTMLSSNTFTPYNEINDIIVDANDNVFMAAAYNTDVQNLFPGVATIHSTVTATKLTATTANGGFGLFQYTFDSSVTLTNVLSTAIQTQQGMIVTLSGFGDPNYNGRFLIETLSGNVITVQPHPYAFYYANALEPSVISIPSFFVPADIVYKLGPNGNGTISEYFLNPSYLTVDPNQNVWVAHHLCRLSMISANDYLVSKNVNVGTADDVLETIAQRNYIVTNPLRNLLKLLVQYDREDKVFQHLEGLSYGTDGNLWVVNDFEGRIYYVPLTTVLTVSTQTSTDFPEPLPGDYDLSRKTYQSIGDWNGWRWINKYAKSTPVATITGATTFDVLPASGLYHVAKINENFDAEAAFKSYRFTDRMIDAENLFTQFIGQMVGDSNADATTLGKLVYERIANFPMNTADIETCVVDALYSICAELDISIDNYQFLLPANLKRIFDLVSIKHSKLWGGRSKFASDFNKRYSLNPSFAKNLGAQLNTQTYIVTAGVPLIFNQLFNNEFKLITPMVLSAFMPGGGLSAYPLSGYTNAWGWGLENGVSGASLPTYYRVYSYNTVYDNTQVEGVIDWNNPQNTILETNSAINAWTMDDGIIDTMLDWQLRKGLGLFDN